MAMFHSFHKWRVHEVIKTMSASKEHTSVDIIYKSYYYPKLITCRDEQLLFFCEEREIYYSSTPEVCGIKLHLSSGQKAIKDSLLPLFAKK